MQIKQAQACTNSLVQHTMCDASILWDTCEENLTRTPRSKKHTCLLHRLIANLVHGENGILLFQTPLAYKEMEYRAQVRITYTT